MTNADILLLIDNIDTTGSEGTSGQELKDIFTEIVNKQGGVKKMWFGEFSQSTPGGTPTVTEIFSNGFGFQGVNRSAGGGGTVITFSFDFTGASYVASKTALICGDGKIVRTTGTPAYVATITNFTVGNNQLFLSALPLNDLSGNPKDLNNAVVLKIILVEYE